MKFDVFKWDEVKPNEDHKAPQGRLRIMCSEEAKIYVEQEGYEALAAVGHSCDLQFAGAARFRVEAPERARVFVEHPRPIHRKAEGEVFTNIDRQPQESGNVLEVTKAVRQMQVEAMQIRKNLKSDFHKARLAARKLKQQTAQDPARASPEQASPEQTDSSQDNPAEPQA